MMKTRRFLFLLAALLGLSGCPDTPCFSGGSTAGIPNQPSVVLVGEQVQLTVRPQSMTGCGSELEELPVPTSLSVEISGPDNLPVESQATLGSPSTSAATVRFTPGKPGRYHVFAAFDPVGGIQQFDLYAARDRSDEAPLQTLPQTCGALERTQRGGWLCDGSFVRDGTVLRQFTGRVAVAGDVVWVVSETSVQRFVDKGGTTLESSASLSHSQGSVEFLLASADELVILHGTTVQRITFDGTALTSTGTSSWQPGAGPLPPLGPRGILLRAGEQLAIISSTATSTGPATLACPYRLEAGRFVRTSASCQTFTSQVVGFEPSILWTGSQNVFTGSFDDLRRLEWTGSGLVEQASLPLGMSLELSTRASGLRTSIVPVINVPFSANNPRPRGTVAVYSPEQRTILLELLDPEIPEPVASTRLLWGSPATGGTGAGLRVRVRPSTP